MACQLFMQTISKHPSVLVFDRQTGITSPEAIYGERWLRLTYGTFPGKAAAYAAFGRAWFSILFGAWMNTRFSARKIPSFISRFSIKMEEFEVPVGGWKSFNEFFSRKLRPGTRPVDAERNSIVLPADGRHSAYPDGADLSGLVVKGRPFTLAELFGSEALARPFQGGALVVSRLCPTDYHRFHFPLSGIPANAVPIRGRYDSVSPVAIRAGARSLCENRRTITILHTQSCGDVALIEVGAACVGRIEQTFTPDTPVEKGDEKGLFLFGGSTVITVFGKGRAVLAEDLVNNTASGVETYAKMGGVMGRIAS
jgi:phosphatidylserine decarboxylase